MSKGSLFVTNGDKRATHCAIVTLNSIYDFPMNVSILQESRLTWQLHCVSVYHEECMQPIVYS